MIVSFKNVDYQIPNSSYIYRDFNLSVFKGQHFGILGKNGAGKSTMIEIIMGLRQIKSGEVEVFGENPQDSDRLHKNKIFSITNDMTIPGGVAVKDLLEFYKFFYPKYDLEIEKECLAIFEIDANKKFGSLSTGQKIKALLTAAFSSKAQLILFDEVTAVLDPKSRRNFFKYLEVYKTKHEFSLLMATNIAEDLHESVEKVIFIDDDHKVLIKDVELLDSLFELDEYKEAS